MTRSARLAAIVGVLMLSLNITPSWGQGQTYNPTASDEAGNTAGGSSTLLQVQTGSNNTAFGSAALFNTLNASNNTAVGADALGLNLTGNNNTACGTSTLENNSTGNLNVALGFQGLQNNAAGNNNTAIGAKALKKALGTKNIGIGYQAGVTLQTGNNNIYIGNVGNGDESQTIRVGTAQTQTFIAGIAGAFIANDRAEVFIDTSTGQLGLGPMISSERYKQDILPMGASSESVLQLRPVTFSYKQDAQRTKHYGLIAEEVARLYPELVTRTASGEPQAVQYQELIPMLLNELQRQQQAIKRQEQELAEMSVLRKEMAELRALVGQGREIAASSR
jgi:hypothetical protein